MGRSGFATGFFRRKRYTGGTIWTGGIVVAVYLDLVVLLNFLVDFLLLLGTNRLAGYPTGVVRAIPAAVLGGLYGGACVLPGFRFLGNSLWRIVSLGLMGLLAFGTGAGMIRRCVLFVLLSFSMGGVAVGLGGGSFWGLIAGAAGICALGVVSFWGKQGQQFVPMTLCFGDRMVSVVALRDTGNSLRDPVTGESVVILGSHAAETLTGLTRQQLRNPVETMASGVLPGLRLIPYRAVGQGQGMLLALRVKQERGGSLLVALAPDGLGDGHGEFEALTGGMV